MDCLDIVSHGTRKTSPGAGARRPKFSIVLFEEYGSCEYPEYQYPVQIGSNSKLTFHVTKHLDGDLDSPESSSLRTKKGTTKNSSSKCL